MRSTNRLKSMVNGSWLNVRRILLRSLMSPHSMKIRMR